MIAFAEVVLRDYYLLIAGSVVLIAYLLLRICGRDPVRRGPSPAGNWTPWEALLLILATLFLQGVFSSIAAQLGVESRSRRALVSWAAPLSVCLYVYWSYLRQGSAPGHEVRWLRPEVRGFFTGVLFWLATVPVILAVYNGWAHVYHALGGVPEEQEILKVLESDTVAFFLTAVIFAPLAEEVLFRGLLFPSLKRFGGTAAAILLSAGLFALAHYDLTVGPALFTMGVFLALSYEMTGTLWTPIGFHAAFNLWTFLGKAA